MEGEFVLVARDDFTAVEKPRLRWRRPRIIIKALSNYVFKVEGLRTGDLYDIHGSWLHVYHDVSLNTKAIMLHVVSSQTGTVVRRMPVLVDSDD